MHPQGLDRQGLDRLAAINVRLLFVLMFVRVNPVPIESGWEAGWLTFTQRLLSTDLGQPHAVVDRTRFEVVGDRAVLQQRSHKVL